MRLHELPSLRVKDVDFEMDTITVRSGKGDKDRVTLLSAQLKPDLQQQIARVGSAQSAARGDSRSRHLQSN